MKIQKAIVSAFGLMAIATLVAPAHAAFTNLAPNGTVTPVGTGSITGLTQVGTEESGSINALFGTAVTQGTITSDVYQGNGGLLFSYTLNLTSTTTDPVIQLQLGDPLLANSFGFTNVATSVAYFDNGGIKLSGTPQASRNANSTISFNFANPNIGAGGKSVTLLVQTNAATVSKVAVSDAVALRGGFLNINKNHDGFISAPGFKNILGTNPVLAPEPSSFAVFGFIGLGLLGLGLRARRNGSASQTA